MTRDIKFRFWDINQEKMITWEEVQDQVIEGWFDNPGVIPLQYTRLKSKNNIEVYEDDILEDFNHRKYLIKWRKAGFCMNSLADEDIKTRDYFLTSRPFHEYIIVGNKYENPELLKQ